MARLVLAGTLAASYGIYGPAFELGEHVPREAGSEEYLDSEKYEVKQRKLAGAPLLPLVRRLNEVRRAHPALQRVDDVTFVETENDNLFGYVKQWEEDGLIVVVNLDPFSGREGVAVLPAALGFPPAFGVEDLLTGATYTWHTGRNYVGLGPGQSHVLHVR